MSRQDRLVEDRRRGLKNSIGYTGGGAHNTMQPSLVTSYIIRF